MTALAPVTMTAIERLEAALASKAIPAKEAQTCARLLENLRRPVRVGLIGTPEAGPAKLLAGILDQHVIPAGFATPTMELRFGATPSVSATLADASVIERDRLPDADLMRLDPVFLQVSAPFEALRRMSFLHLSLSEDTSERRQALYWAANRVELTLWCSNGFPQAEAVLWENAPELMKNHAFLVATGAHDNPGVLRQRVGAEFEGVFAVDLGAGAKARGLGQLMRRINADIDEAHLADLDAARLFLHRFGQGDAARASLASGAVLAKAAEPAPQTARMEAPALPPAAAQPVTPPPSAMAAALADSTIAPPRSPQTRIVAPAKDPEAQAAMRATVSEPLLYLKRRSRALLEMLEWDDMPSGDWANDVLEHCCETTEALKDRADAWPDDDPDTETLRDCVEEAWDVAILMQIEGGEAQARDAATMMVQLRGEFERAMAA